MATLPISDTRRPRPATEGDTWSSPPDPRGGRGASTPPRSGVPWPRRPPQRGAMAEGRLHLTERRLRRLPPDQRRRWRALLRLRHFLSRMGSAIAEVRPTPLRTPRRSRLPSLGDRARLDVGFPRQSTPAERSRAISCFRSLRPAHHSRTLTRPIVSRAYLSPSRTRPDSNLETVAPRRSSSPESQR